MLLSFDILKSHINLLNKINVFPVADGDTGNNLYFAVKSLQNFEINKIQDLHNLDSNKVIMFGRGCSGNIFSLFLYKIVTSDSDNLSEMCKEAAKFTWDTMYEPVEGTILTAMKDVPESYESPQDFIYKFIQNTYKNLFNGPNLLPVLKENKTLDSGTLGFLYILCDIYKCMTGKDISPNIELDDPVYIVNVDTEDRYCVEISLVTENNKLKSSLSKLGSELIYLASEDNVKFHIHTNNYLEVIDLCKSYGKIINYKIEDMLNKNNRIFI